jgi:hypothetical protein
MNHMTIGVTGPSISAKQYLGAFSLGGGFAGLWADAGASFSIKSSCYGIFGQPISVFKTFQEPC